MKQKAKIVYLDVETSPNISYTWQGMHEVDVIDIKQEWFILSFAYKVNDGPVKVRGLIDYETFRKDKADDGELVKELWAVLDMADVVCGHNIDRFDIRKIYSRFLAHGLTLPSAFKTVDTLKVARKMFHLNSNRLDYLARYLGVGAKAETGGFKLWLDCMAGVRSAWRTMKEYNKHDVEITEKVYLALRPFITNHPNANLLNGTTHSCPSCGSSDLQRRGYAMTRVGKYQRWSCNDCGSWSTGERINADRVILR